MKKSDTLEYELSKKSVILIFLYFFLLLAGGGITLIVLLLHLFDDNTLKHLIVKTILSSLSASSMLCSTQYIKRLYKACITGRVIECKSFFRCFGNIIYFLTRPFFAYAFVILMIFSLLSGMFLVTGSLDYIINEKFLYLCVILSSFIGYSIGHIIDKFEIISKETVDKTMK